MGVSGDIAGTGFIDNHAGLLGCDRTARINL